MINPILQQVRSRRSIRRYTNEPVPEDIMARILEAALRTSSSGNMQAFSIIVTTDPEVRQAMRPAHFDQSMVTEAPAFLTFCADFHRMRRWLELREAPPNFDNFISFMIAAIDATLAAQTAALAAEAEGLGICFLGTTLASCGEIAKILKCPSHVMPVVGFSLGYPNEEPIPRDRLPLANLVHRDVYREESDEEILAAYRDREVHGWNRYMANPELRETTERNCAKNLAQIYTMVKYTRESHQQYSKIVLDCLLRQGFWENEPT